MVDDEFSARLGTGPDRVYLEDLRRPEYEFMAEHFFDPLVICNRAQVIMLTECDLLDEDAAVALFDAIDEIEAAGNEPLTRYEDFEDPYFQMEERITTLAGERAGGQLHTGRSRNDLYAAVVRVIARERLLTVIEAVLELRSTVQDRAENSVNVVMPGFTHSQPAQPITLGHYLTAFDHLLERDGTRLVEAYESANRSPLGAAALGGTGFDIDRERLAELVGFDGLCVNTYDAVASMDYVPEAMNALALLMTNLSRLSRDLIEWATYEFEFIEIADSLSTVSSIMPQKKNPVVLEKTRTAASDVIGGANSALVHLKSAPFGDVREVSKYVFVPLFEQSEEVVRSLRLLTAVIETLTVNEERMLSDATTSFCTTTELADTLVRKTDLTFRQAHTVVARIVRDTYEADGTALDIETDDVTSAAKEILGIDIDLPASELSSALDPEQNVQRRAVIGGTAPESTRADLEVQDETLSEQRNWLFEAANQLDEAAMLRRKREADLV